MSLSSDPNMTAAAALVPQGKHAGQAAIALVRPATVIGARQRSHVHLLSRSVSKAHAILIRTRGGFYVRDLASRTGVYLSGRQVREADLAHGDLIKVGNFVFRFDASSQLADAPRAARAPEAAFEVEGNAIPFPVQDRSILIGRRPDCDVSLIESSVSTAHALLFDADGRWFLRDLSSRTGTWLNGTKIHQQEVRFGDDIRIGETSMRFVPSTADALRPNVDELEDLVGTAPLLEPEPAEIPEQLLLPPADSIAATRAARADAAPVAPDPVRPAPQPPAPVAKAPANDADAPVPLDIDFDDPILGATDASAEPEPAATAPVADPQATDPVAVEPAAPAPAVGKSESEADLRLKVDGDDDANDNAVADDRLKIDFDDAHDEPAVPAATMPVPGSGVMAPMGVMQAEGRDGNGDKGIGDKSNVGDLVEIEQEIDLANDPDVSGPADTTALKFSPSDTPRTPALSDRVVDTADNADTISEGQRLLVDADVTADRSTPSATAAAGLQDAAEDDAGLDAGNLQGRGASTEPAPVVSEVPLENRRGWRRPRDPVPTKQAPAVEAPAPPMPPAPVSAQPIVAAMVAPVSVPTPVPQPTSSLQEEPSGLDLSETIDEVPAVPEAEPAVALRPDVLAGTPTDDDEQKLNLGLVPPDPESGARVDEPAVQPLIAPDAFDAPKGAPPEKPRRARRTTTTAKKAAAPKAPAEPKVPEPKSAKPAIRKPTVAPVKPVAAPAKPAARKGRVAPRPMPVAEDVAPVVASFALPDPVDDLPPQTFVRGNAAEVIETTEPTPESALDLGEVSDEAGSTGPTPLIDSNPADLLSDTGFGRQINDFAGSAAEPVIDEPLVREPLAIDEPLSLDEPPHAVVSSTFDRDFDAGELSAASSELSFDLDEPRLPPAPIPSASIAPPPPLPVPLPTASPSPAQPPEVLDVEEVEIEPTAFAAEVSPTNEVVESEGVEPEVERPRSALEQIAASFTAAPLDEVEVDQDPLLDHPMPSMGVLEADAATAAEAPPQPIDLPEAEAELTEVLEASPEVVVDEEPSPAAPVDAIEEIEAVDEIETLESLGGPATGGPATHVDDLLSDTAVAEAPVEDAPEAAVPPPPPPAPVAEKPASPVLVENDSHAWRMPDESDLLLPPDDDSAVGLNEGRDEASFIGGMPLPLNRGPIEVKPPPWVEETTITDDRHSAEPDEASHPVMDESPGPLADEQPEAVEPAAPVAPDLVAAAAAAAAAQPQLPPRPRVGRRPTPFAKTPFDEIPETPPEFEGDMVPPFAGPGPATFGRVTTAFDGLAMPPVREADVFSHQVPGHVIGENRRPRPATPGAGVTETGDSTLGLTPETLEYAAAGAMGAGKSGRPATPGFRPPPSSSMGDGHRPQQPRKRKWFGLKWLLPLMFLTMVLTGTLIHWKVKVVTPVRGTVAYNNLDKASESVRSAIQVAQKRLAVDPGIRQQAASIAPTKRSGIAAGFLADAVAIDRNLTVDFPPPGNRMVIEFASTDPGRDAVRMEALLEAIATANQNMKDAASRLAKAEQEALAAVEATKDKLKDRANRIKLTREAGEARPPGEDLDAAETRLEQLEAAHIAALQELTTAKAAAEQLRATPSPDGDRLAALERQQADAQRALDEASKAQVDGALKVNAMRVARTEAQTAYEAQVELEKEIAGLKLDLEDQQAAATAATTANSTAITEVKTAAADRIEVPEPHDPRVLYIVLSTGAIAAFFGLLLALTWLLGRRSTTPDAAPLQVDAIEDDATVSATDDATEPRAADKVPATV